MKILNEGQYQKAEQWKGTFDCKRCGLKAEIDVNDVTSTYYDGDWRDPSYYTHEVTCPNCGLKARLTGLTEVVKHALQTKAKR